jgi:acetoin utilization deacetylase AcuC-like enzyme
MLPHLVYITHPLFSRHEMGQGHPECPARLDAIHDHLVGQGLMDYLHTETARAATDEELLRAHSQQHLDNLAFHAPKQGYSSIDADTVMNCFTLEAARHAAGAAVQAVDLILSGQAQRAFCAVRPPGHHAERQRAMGFCFYNNVAVAALHSVAAHGISRAAIVDFDVHHGNGTENIIADNANIFMASTFQKQLYPFSGEIPQGLNMLNIGLPPRTRGDVMRTVVSEQLLPALDAFKPELIFISAGFDAHLEDDMANLGWCDADYAWITARIVEVSERHAQGRIVSSLEGGYALAALGRSVAAHIAILLGINDA